MWTFQYKHGDRPLDGYTIQRAAGRGGFGEVYYAVSDSGREVALKVVTGYEQIEVRGISQCMNLKSPHLVTIFDVKYNDQGRPFVIMEFVEGPNLRQLLDDSPAGLGTQKAAFFLREIGKGLTFLHDCGIVHRDLKPANIFFENGYVKIGDYGLSKAISPTQHSGQTVTVGTVHYMAPEVGAGKYDRSIDIYALGAVLYEMLTGTVPFIGASPSEILIKHLQADPDCAGIPEPFCTVIRKAMAKDPLQRYANVQEMVEAVFGAEHVQMSMSHFSPGDLSMVAGRVAQKIGIGAPGSGAIGGIGNGGLGGNSGSSSVIGGETVNSRNPNRFANDADNGGGWQRVMNQPFDQLRNRMDQLGGKSAFPAQTASENGINDPLSIGTRRMLGLLTAVVVAIAASVLIDTSKRLDPIELFFFVFTAVCGASVGLLVGWRKIAIPKLASESHAVRKMVVGTVACGSLLLISGIFWMAILHDGGFHNMTLLAILAPLGFSNTWEWIRANRAERISLYPSIQIGIAGVVVSWIFHGDAMLSFAVLAGISLAAQVASPWDPILAKRRSDMLRSKIRGADKDERETATPQQAPGNVAADSSGASPPQAKPGIFANLHVESPVAPANNWGTSLRPKFPVWQYAQLIWFLAAILSFSIGLTCVIVGASSQVFNQEDSFFISFGVCGLINWLICFVYAFKKTYSTLWAYLGRPILMMGCIFLITLFSAVVANETNPDGFSIFAIIFSSIGLMTLPFLRFGKNRIPAAAAVIPPPIMNPNPTVAVGAAIGRFGSTIGGKIMGIPPIPPIPPLQVPPSAASTNDADPSVPPPLNWMGYPKYSRDYSRWRRWDRGRRVQKGKNLLSIVSGALIFLCVLQVLVIGLNLPLAVSLNLPDMKTAHSIRSNFIGDYPDWRILTTKLLCAAALLSAVLAMMTSLIARSGSNFLHLLRAVIGIAGLLFASLLVAGKFDGGTTWPMVASLLNAKPPAPDKAIDAIITAFQNPATIVGGFLFIISVVILCISRRDRTAPQQKEAA